MRWLAFLYRWPRAWAVFWIVALFIGLLPPPPAVELAIVGGFVTHMALIVGGRLHRAAQRRALAQAERAEDEEYRRRRRRRYLQGEAGTQPAGGELVRH